MFRGLLIASSIVLAGCATTDNVIVKYVEKDKLNLGPIPELKLNRTSEWFMDDKGNAVISLDNLEQHFRDLTKILEYQLQLKNQLEQIKNYYQEN